MLFALNGHDHSHFNELCGVDGEFGDNWLSFSSIHWYCLIQQYIVTVLYMIRYAGKLQWKHLIVYYLIYLFFHISTSFLMMNW